MEILIAIFSLLSFCLIYIYGKIGYKLDLVDIPNKRKIHSKNVAYTGGLAISSIYIFSISLFDIFINDLHVILSFAFLISLVGIIDDKYNLNVGGKLSLQIFPIVYLIIMGNLSLNQIGDYNYFKLELNSFSIPFTLFCVIFLINSFNYFDGLDGTLSFATISVLAILYFLSPDSNLRLFLSTIFLPLLFFLCFNFTIFKLPKLFLGDSGSLLLGFIIGFILIYMENQKIAHPILLAWSISIFVYEFVSVNLIRLISKKNIFKAGSDHLHHILFKKTNSIFLTNLLIMIKNIIFFTIGYSSFKLINPLASFILFFYIFIVFLVIRIRLIKK